MTTYSHRGWTIEPKRDFGPHGYLSNGKIIRKGWLAIRRGMNVMPGATWFSTVREARAAIDVYIRVRGVAAKFWEAMQPFNYKVGQRVPETPYGGSVEHGRWKAVIEAGVVTSVTKVPWRVYLKAS